MAAQMQSWVKRLVDGEEGRSVLASMRKQYKNPCTLTSKISRLRTAFVETGTTHKDFKKGEKRIYELAEHLPKGDKDREFAMLFKASSLRDKVHQHRSLHWKTGHKFKDDGLQKAFEALRILPDTLKSLRADDGELGKCEVKAVKTKLKRNEEMIIVQNGDAVYERIRLLLQPPKKEEEETISELILGLCAASGRRSAEIANGRSEFRPMPKQRYGAIFSGQLKKKGKKRETKYTIALLVPFEEFATALERLRERQGDVSHLSNKEISIRYQGNLSRAMKDTFPQLSKGRAHDLRAMYARMVYQAFDWQASFNFVTMRMLGHDTLEQSLSYNTVEVKNLELSLGKFEP